MEEITAYVVEIARLLELEVEPEDVTEVPQPHIKHEWKQSCSLRMSNESCVEMESVPGEDAVKIVEMTTEDLEYHIDFVHKAAAGLEWIDSNFERNAMDKMLSKQHFMLQRKHS